MKTKTILPIAVVAIFMTIAFAPAVTAENHTLNVAWIPEDDTAAQHEQVTLDQNEFDTLWADITEFYEWLGLHTPLADLKLTAEEQSTIREYVAKIKLDLQKSPLIQGLTEDCIVNAILSGLEGKRLVFALFWGRSLMPFNPDEWGWSGLNPFKRFLTFRMTAGYLGTVHHRPLGGFTGYDKMGRYIVSVQGLMGLWIDGGSLGYERFFKSGIEVIIGRARVFPIPSIIGSH